MNKIVEKSSKIGMNKIVEKSSKIGMNKDTHQIRVVR